MANQKRINGLTFQQWLEEVFRDYMANYGALPETLETTNFPFFNQWVLGCNPMETCHDFYWYDNPAGFEVTPDPYGYAECDDWRAE